RATRPASTTAASWASCCWSSGRTGSPRSCCSRPRWSPRRTATAPVGDARLLAVTERLSLQGGADRYLHELILAAGGAWRILHGYADATAAPVVQVAEHERLRPLERRVPHGRDAEAMAQLRAAVAAARPAAV